MPGPSSVHDLESSAAAAQRAAATGDVKLTTPAMRPQGPPLSARSGPALLLESGLLTAIYARARHRRCSAVELTLTPDGGVELLLSGIALSPSGLEGLAAGIDDVAGRGATWERLLASAPGVELDLFEERGPGEQDSQWHLAIVDGVWMGRLARVLRPEPVPGQGGGALRIRLRAAPDQDALHLDEESDLHDLLIEQLADLAMLAPGLETIVTVPSEGLLRSTLLPRGPGQRLAESTAGRVTLLEEPLELEARWQGLRARCAVQWCVDCPSRLWGFEDGKRTGASDAAISVLLSTLRAGLALHARGGLEVVPLGRLMRGLTAIVTLDRVRAPQRCETVRGSLSPEGDVSEADLMEQAVRELTPLLVGALAVNPRADRLLRWVIEVPLDEVGSGAEQNV